MYRLTGVRLGQPPLLEEPRKAHENLPGGREDPNVRMRPMKPVVEIVSKTAIRRTANAAMLGALTMLSVAACAKGDADRPVPGDSSAVPVTPSGQAPPAVAQPGTGTASSGAAGSSPAAASPPAAATPAASATGGVSVTTGVFTVAQAARGEAVYTTSCALCHTMAQHSGTGFAAAWNGRRVADLYDIIRNTMPLDNPGGLSDQEYVDVVAYMLQLNGVPAGKR